MENKKILDKVKTRIAISNFEKLEMNKKMPKTNILKSAAIFILALGIVSGVAYAGIRITEIFKIKGIDDTGIQTALQNDYVQNIEMDYIEKEKVKFKVDYLMMDDINFDLVFNFVTEDNVDNYEQIAITNLKITDENNNQIYINSEDQEIWTKNIALTSEWWSVVEKHDNLLRQVVHLSSNNFPRSNKIYVSFDSVVLYNVNKGNPITIEYDDEYKLEFDVSKQLSERISIEYEVKNSNYIDNAKLTNSGFEVIINSDEIIRREDNYSVEDSNGNRYTLSNVFRIYDGENLDKIDKQVLIFNLTRYNTTDTITLKRDNGKVCEFVKKDKLKAIQVTYNFSDGNENAVYTKVYFLNNKIMFQEQIQTFKSEEDAKEQYDKIKNVDGKKLEGNHIIMTLYFPEDYEMDYEGYIDFLNKEKERGGVKEYFEVDN